MLHIEKNIWHIIIPILMSILIFFIIYVNIYGYLVIETDDKIYVSINNDKNFVEYNNKPIKLNTGKNTVFIKSNNPKHQIYVEIVDIKYKKNTVIKPVFLIKPNMIKTDLNRPIFLYKDQIEKDYDDNLVNFLSTDIGTSINTDNLIGKIRYIHMINENEFYIVTKTTKYLILYKYYKDIDKIEGITGFIENIVFTKDMYIYTIKNNNKYEMYINKNNNLEKIEIFQEYPIFDIFDNTLLIIIPNKDFKSQKVYTLNIENYDIKEYPYKFDFLIKSIKSTNDGFLLKGYNGINYIISYFNKDLTKNISFNYNSDIDLSLVDYFNENIYFVDYVENTLGFYIYNEHLKNIKTLAGIKNPNIFINKIKILNDNKMYIFDDNAFNIYLMDLDDK